MPLNVETNKNSLTLLVSFSPMDVFLMQCNKKYYKEYVQRITGTEYNIGSFIW